MANKIKSVQPREDTTLLVHFQNGIEKIYDVKKLYSIFPQFKAFEKDKELFNQVRVDVGGYGISWNDDLDLDAEDIWEEGTETGNVEPVDFIIATGLNIMNARESVGLTQKELARKTGIDQADISKIERGILNPSLNKIKRLAAGMDMELKLVFTPLQKG